MDEAPYTTTCPKCGKGFARTTGPYQAGPDDPDAKPDRVRCIEGHMFALLDSERTSGGQAQYKLGPEIEPE